MAWIKKDTGTLKDPKIVDLLAQPKGAEAYVLWDAALFEAYHQTPKGEFVNDAHFKACVGGVADVRHLKRLLDLGLLTKTDSGSIIVTNWHKHQADPTAAARPRPDEWPVPQQERRTCPAPRSGDRRVPFGDAQ